PSLNDLSSTASCSAYASSMKAYLMEHTDKFENIMNASWFSDFSQDDSTPYYHETCRNNVCAVEYDGGDHGCYVAGAAHGKPIQQLYSILQNAYHSAISESAIGNLGRYGFKGMKETCVSANQFSGCELSSK
ncbi:MAG TPA: hypothetical protein VHM20_03875, partial [Gammaproteobacteria bacterium]|nr:hypothetical protein [Gammaproteobacteria bacterium]